jgi:hypothetical protein
MQYLKRLNLQGANKLAMSKQVQHLHHLANRCNFILFFIHKTLKLNNICLSSDKFDSKCLPPMASSCFFFLLTFFFTFIHKPKKKSKIVREFVSFLFYRIFNFIFKFHKLRLSVSLYGVMHNLFSKYDNWCLVNFQDFLIHSMFQTPTPPYSENPTTRGCGRNVCLRKASCSNKFSMFSTCSVLKMQLSLKTQGLCMQLSNLFGCVFSSKLLEIIQ